MYIVSAKFENFFVASGALQQSKSGPRFYVAPVFRLVFLMRLMASCYISGIYISLRVCLYA